MAVSDLAPARAPAWRGVVHAFGRGMDPRHKDGVRLHPWVLSAGVLLHGAVLATTVTLAVGVAGGSMPALLVSIFVTVQLAGIAAATGLLVRRVRTPLVRVISIPDDYFSNVLVTAFLGAGLAFLLWGRAWPIFVGISAVLVLYAPFGKIRHCALFFTTRFRLGVLLGRRGVLPSPRPRR
jgi:hypothetical protein